MTSNPGNHADSDDRPRQDDDHVADLTMDTIVSRLERHYEQAAPPSPSGLFDLTGKWIGDYRIMRRIGLGAFGIVYEANDEEHGRSVALKIPRPEVLADRERLSRFQLEADTASRLEHPNIVQVFHADLNSDPPYIATAFCDGPNLAQWIEKQEERALPKQAASLVSTLALAVEHAHENGVIHRDLKPSNVMLTSDRATPCELEDYTPRLTDFGLARLLDPTTRLTGSSLVIGTPLYMAPEQAECRFDDIGPRTDVFALGAILYELLTGQPPFAAMTYAAVIDRLRHDQPIPARRSNPAVASDLETVVMKCLRREPDDRYASAAELAEDLERYCFKQPVKARPTSWAHRLRRWSLEVRRVPELMSIVIALSCVRAVFAWLGLLLLAFLNETDISAADLQEVLMIHLFFTTPLELAIIVAARRQLRHRLHDAWYWVVLVSSLTLASVLMLIAWNLLPTSAWYMRHPGARSLMFTVVGLMFAAQSVCWYLADHRRLNARGSATRRGTLKLGFFSAAFLVLTGAVILNVTSEQLAREYVGPDKSLYFDGVDDHVTVKSVGFAESTPFTLEAWIQFEGNDNGAIATYGPLALFANAASERFGFRVLVNHPDESMLVIDTPIDLLKSKWTHTAVTYDGKSLKIFINGKLQALSTFGLDRNSESFATSMPEPLVMKDLWPGSDAYIGGIVNLNSVEDPFHGRIGELRLSSSVHYRGDFEPQQEPSTEPNTVILLGLDTEGKKQIAIDQTQNHKVVFRK